MKQLISLLIILFFVGFVAAQDSIPKNDTLKKHHFNIFGFTHNIKNVTHKLVHIEDTLYVSPYQKHKKKVRYHKEHFNHLKQYESGLYEVKIKHKSLHELFDDIAKASNTNFTLIGITDVAITAHIETFDLEYLVDEICYENEMIAVKEHNRYIIYGIGSEKIVKNADVIYKYNPRNIEASELITKANELKVAAKLQYQQAQNTIIISGTLSDVKETITRIRTLDVEAKKVSIELLIVEYNHGDNFTWDFDITSAKSQRLSNVNYIPGGNTIGFTYDFLSDLKPNFKVNLKALAEKNLANVITNPRVMTLNNKEAKIDLQETIYVELQVASINGITTNLNPVNAGTTLTVTPKIMNNGLIQLDVNAINSIFLPQETNGEITTQKNTLTTQVLIRNGETLILGGLIKASESNGRGGVPILRDIPLIGLLFRKASKRINYIETVIYITPYMNPLRSQQTIHAKNKLQKIQDKLEKEGKKLERTGIRKAF